LRRVAAQWASVEQHDELLVYRLRIGQLRRRSANCAGIAGMHVGDFSVLSPLSEAVWTSQFPMLVNIAHNLRLSR
jgi:hypothetical protein